MFHSFDRTIMCPLQRGNFTSFANVDYWVDWVMLLAVALGLGFWGALLAMPVVAIVVPRRAARGQIR